MATEIAFLKVKDSYTPDEVKMSLQYFKPRPPGFQAMRWGPTIEDPQTIVWLLNWDSVEAHEEYTTSPLYPAFIDTVKVYCIGFSYFHTYLKPYPITLVFEAAVIKISQLAAQTGTAEDGSPLSVEVTKLVHAITKAPGYHSYFRGLKYEDKSICILLEGWDSIEAHDAAKESEDIQRVLKNIEDLNNIEKSSRQFVRLYRDQLLEL
ncbi:hypothetical protein BU17DRAFT_87656 [Hysterangium stoloniferum]|nr:hypothetical protein BU17DRAFT_87656 [Hysterangium stoloniferum]